MPYILVLVSAVSGQHHTLPPMMGEFPSAIGIEVAFLALKVTGGEGSNSANNLPAPLLTIFEGGCISSVPLASSTFSPGVCLYEDGRRQSDDACERKALNGRLSGFLPPVRPPSQEHHGTVVVEATNYGGIARFP